MKYSGLLGTCNTKRRCACAFVGACAMIQTRAAPGSVSTMADLGSSYEPKRTNAYSEDLRWRMIWQGEVLGLKNSEIAANLRVDYSTVRRTVKLFRDTGDVQKKSCPQSTNRKLTPVTTEYFIIHEILKRQV